MSGEQSVDVNEPDLKRAEVVLVGDAATNEQLNDAVDELLGLPRWGLSEVAQRWGISDDRLIDAAVHSIRAKLGQGEHSV